MKKMSVAIKHTVSISMIFHTVIILLTAAVMLYGGTARSNPLFSGVLLVIVVMSTGFTIRNIIRCVAASFARQAKEWDELSSDLLAASAILRRREKELEQYVATISQCYQTLDSLAAVVDETGKGQEAESIQAAQVIGGSNAKA